MTNPEAYLSGAVTCVLQSGDTVLTSEEKGIRPMLQWLEEGKDMRGYSVADKIVGKAAAMLFVKAGICHVYAEVLSVQGKEYLESHQIPVVWKTLTDTIINRRGDGICPMEQTVWEIGDYEEGFRALKAKSEQLRKEARVQS